MQNTWEKQKKETMEIKNAFDINNWKSSGTYTYHFDVPALRKKCAYKL